MHSIVMNLLLLLLTSFSVCEDSHGSDWKEVQSWKRHFDGSKVKGTFLLYDLQKDEYFSYNRKRATTSFVPASTYKIFNSLVALETGVVRDEDEIIKWDGMEKGEPLWNQDQSMRSAIKYSALWFYQEMARRIGQEKMQHYVDLAQYGNRNINGGIDQFWLNGGLRISAKEQVDLLVNLYRNKLPFSQGVMDAVKDILIDERTNEYTLRAKTGWSPRVFKPQIGWWVGYVERDRDAYFFAINIDIVNSQDGAARKKVAKAILRQMNIIK